MQSRSLRQGKQLAARTAQRSSGAKAAAPLPHTAARARAAAALPYHSRMATGAPPAGRVPSIVAFDLDGTLWEPEMYQLRGGAPFRRDAAGGVYDRTGERVRLLGDSMKILQQLSMDPVFSGTEVAYVSRTEYPEWAVPCLQAFLIDGHPQGSSLYDVAPHQEIYPGSKLTHFRRIHEASGVPYADMLFFDNENWNCREVSRLGVKCVYTPRGMTAAAWQQGLLMFADEAPAAAAAGGGTKQRKKHKSRAAF